MNTQNIRIRLKAFDHRVLDASTKEIVSTAKRTGAQGSRSDSPADADREIHCQPLAARRQEVARAVRNSHPQAGARHRRPDAADGRRADEARSRRGRRRRDQAVRDLASVFEVLRRRSRRTNANAFRRYRKEAGHVPRLHRRRRPRAGHRSPGRRAARWSRIGPRRRTAIPRSSSASARPRSRTCRRPSAAVSPSPMSSRRCRLAEFRVDEDKMIPVGAEITADHFAAGQLSTSRA